MWQPSNIISSVLHGVWCDSHLRPLRSCTPRFDNFSWHSNKPPFFMEKNRFQNVYAHLQIFRQNCSTFVWFLSSCVNCRLHVRSSTNWDLFVPISRTVTFGARSFVSFGPPILNIGLLPRVILSVFQSSQDWIFPKIDENIYSVFDFRDCFDRKNYAH